MNYLGLVTDLACASWFLMRTTATGGGCRNKADFCEDVREQYKEMREEFMAGLEDRKYLTIDQVRAKAYQVVHRRALQTTRTLSSVLISCDRQRELLGLMLLSQDVIPAYNGIPAPTGQPVKTKFI